MNPRTRSLKKTALLTDQTAGVDASTGKYSWSVDADLGDLATYGIMITLESNAETFQYGFPFKIIPAEGSTSSSTSLSPSSSVTVPATTTASESKTHTSASASKTASVSQHSSAPVTSAIASSTLVSSTIRGNMSTSATDAETTITSVVTPGPSSTQTTSSTLIIANNGVAIGAAGGFAMLGGVAMALLAL